MPKRSVISKTVASIFVILTISAIAGIVTMVVLYNTELSTLKASPPPTTVSATTRHHMRLPKDLIPHSYKVFLQPHMYTRIIEMENVTSPNQTILFTGNSTVNFHCAQTTTAIYLHSRDLTLLGEAVVMNTKANKRINARVMIPYNEQSDFLEIQLDESLEAGEDYSLFLAFKGQMSEGLDGLYVSSYSEGMPASENETNKTR